MTYEEREKAFKRAVYMCRRGMLDDAARLFRQLVDAGSLEPLHLSYCGLLTATVHGNRSLGVQLCRRSLQYGIHEPQVVLNAARLYEKLGDRGTAVKVLREGLRATPASSPLVEMIDRLAPRRKPVLGGRDSPWNKHLGRFVSRFIGSPGVS